MRNKIEKIMDKIFESVTQNWNNSPYLCKQNPYGAKEATEELLQAIRDEVLSEEMKDILHSFAVSYDVSSRESREKCLNITINQILDKLDVVGGGR